MRRGLYAHRGTYPWDTGPGPGTWGGPEDSVRGLGRSVPGNAALVQHRTGSLPDRYGLWNTLSSDTVPGAAAWPGGDIRALYRAPPGKPTPAQHVPATRPATLFHLPQQICAPHAETPPRPRSGAACLDRHGRP